MLGLFTCDVTRGSSRLGLFTCDVTQYTAILTTHVSLQILKLHRILNYIIMPIQLTSHIISE